MSAALQIPVGVVVERLKADSPWIDFIWRPVSVLLGEPTAEPWSKLADDGDSATFYAGRAEVSLHTTETANYRDNLALDHPWLWVVLRPTGVEPPYEVIRVTADPDEGEGFSSAGDDLVDTVPMPDAFRDTLEAFVAQHHVERPFFKRKRDRANPEALAHRPRPDENDE